MVYINLCHLQEQVMAQHFALTLRWWVVPAILALAACGGGSSEPAVAPAPIPTPDPLVASELIDLAKAQVIWEIADIGVGGDADGDAGASGGAGDGSALKRASVVLIDAAGKVLTGQTDDNGRYLIKFKLAQIKVPLVLKVVDAGGSVLASTTDQALAMGKVARININPLTDKIVSDSLKSSVSGTDKSFTGADIDLSKLAMAKTNLIASIQAALATAGIADASKFDPVQSVYNYDGKGIDAVIESISHTRDPVTGATVLTAKLTGVVTNTDGTTVPTVISSATPLATTQVAIDSNPALTFSKITAWVNYLNGCLATTAAPNACPDADQSKLVSADYLQNSKDFDEDFSTLFSESDRSGIKGSVISNPNILFFTRYSGSTIDDAAVVEVTIRQPRTGPLAGNQTAPLEYTKVLVFKRDDVTAGLKAGNWVLYGNRKAFNWSVIPRYFTFQNINPLLEADWSRTTSGFRLSFSPSVFDRNSRTYASANVYAIRLKGPGLPASGVVFAPYSLGANTFSVLNKTGVIPAEGVKSNNAQTDFRIAGVVFPTGASIPPERWQGNPAGSNSAVYSDTQFADLSQLQAYNVYTAEFYKNGSATPIVETTRILAPLESPVAYVKRPLHDLTPSHALVSPPQAASTSTLVQWVRNPLGVRIESAFVGSSSVGYPSANIPDAFALNAASTSVLITANFPATDANTPGTAREIGLFGTAARAQFNQSIYWSK
jgi:hypothetical protein